MKKKKKTALPFGEPPPWLPDWKDNSAYPDTNYPLRLWAWEFLRRNPEYQANYRHFASVPGSINADDGQSTKSPKWSARAFDGSTDTKYLHCNPPALPNETVGDYELRNCGRDYVLTNLETYYMKKWGVSHLNDPGGESTAMGAYGPDYTVLPPHFFDFESENRVERTDPLWPICGGSSRRLSLRGDPEPEIDSAKHIFVCIDLRYPLDRQIAEIKDEYDRRRENLKRIEALETVNPTGPHLGKLIEYLRVFDAVWHGAKHREIAAELYPRLEYNPLENINKKLIEHPLNAAKRLVRGGYHDLLSEASPNNWQN